MDLKSQYWKYLVEIAKAGGLAGKIPLTTTNLGELVGASQQTASRKLAYLADNGFIHRVDVNGNKVQEISLTEKGIIELRKLHDELALIFSKPREIVMRGKVTSGIGEGKYYVGKYLDFFKKNLAIEPFKGTLNIKLLDERDVLLRGQVEIQGASSCADSRSKNDLSATCLLTGYWSPRRIATERMSRHIFSRSSARTMTRTWSN